MPSSTIQVIIQLLQCNRRASSPTATTQKEGDGKFQHEPTEACEDSGLGDVSTTDDVSEEGSQDQTDSSIEVPNIMPPPGLAPPPGLDAPADQLHEFGADRSPFGADRSYMSFKYWDRVVSRQNQQKTRHAEICGNQRAEVHGGRRSTAPDQPSLHQRRLKQTTPAANDPLVALKEALDKLAPTEIATVKALLDSKIRDVGVRGNNLHAAPWAASNRQVGSGRVQQPFTPFGANTKPAKNAMKEVQDTGDSLRSFLHDLTLLDDDNRVLSVRKISQLGFDSPHLLQTYFSKFGTVDRVMVAHTVVKNKSGPVGTQKLRARPAALGFVVMSTSAEVQAVLNHGETHTVGGADISAFSFQSHSIDGN